MLGCSAVWQACKLSCVFIKDYINVVEMCVCVSIVPVLSPLLLCLSQVVVQWLVKD